jgi:D-arabinose 1-dehydrogenase-like Zn-dependent alcohol dehydrogenase
VTQKGPLPAPPPAVMRAVVLTGHGGFDKLDLRNDVPVPQPGRGEVLIRVTAAGVNNTDINTRVGWYAKDVAAATDAIVAQGGAGDDPESWSGTRFAFPCIQGADVCGRICAVGPDVPSDRIGDRVLVDPILRRGSGYDVQYLGSEVDGGFADYVCVPAGNAVTIHSDLSDVELASLPCAYSAAENILTRLGLQKSQALRAAWALPLSSWRNAGVLRSSRWPPTARPKLCAAWAQTMFCRATPLPAMPLDQKQLTPVSTWWVGLAYPICWTV